MKTTPSLLRLFTLLLAGAALLGRAEIRIHDQPNGKDGDGKESIVVPKPTSGVEGADPSSAVTGSPTDVLFFDNSDAIHGRLLSINPQTGIHWKHADSKQAIDFSPNNVSRIKLDHRKTTVAPSAASCIIRLTNSDELMGNLVSMDAEKLELDTWYAGKVSILRKMVKSITPTQGTTANLYEGPTSIDGWVQGQGQKSWIYSNGSLRSNARAGSIGRDMKLPAVSRIDFDMSWISNLNLMVCFYTDSFEAYNGNNNAYTLTISSGTMYLQRMRRDGGSAQIGQVQVQNMHLKNHARFSICSNKEQSSIWLLMDGERIANWKDPAGFAGTGTGLLFYAQGNCVTKLSNIRVGEWDGKLDEQTGSSSAKTKEDAVRLINNDKVSGKIQTIREGKLVFATSYATLDIAMQRVTQIDMADEQAEQAKRNAGDIRASFSNRGRITLQLEQWDDKQVIGNSQNFGKLKLNPSAFGMIQFNLDREKPETNEPLAPDPDVMIDD